MGILTFILNNSIELAMGCYLYFIIHNDIYMKYFHINKKTDDNLMELYIELQRMK